MEMALAQRSCSRAQAGSVKLRPADRPQRLFSFLCVSQTTKKGLMWYHGGASQHLHGLPGHSKVKFLHSHHPARFLYCRLCAGRGNFHALREENPEILFSWVRNNLQDAECWSKAELWIRYTRSFLMRERNSLFHKVPLLHVIFVGHSVLFTFKLKYLYFSLWNGGALKNESSFV